MTHPAFKAVPSLRRNAPRPACTDPGHASSREMRAGAVICRLCEAAPAVRSESPSDAVVGQPASSRNPAGRSSRPRGAKPGAGHVPLEREVQSAILAALSTVPGCHIERLNTGAISAEHNGKKRFVRFGSVGAPDIRVTRRRRVRVAVNGLFGEESNQYIVIGQSFGLEVKRPGKKATAAQAAWGRAFEAAGGVYRVVHGVDEAIAAVGEWPA